MPGLMELKIGARMLADEIKQSLARHISLETWFMLQGTLGCAQMRKSRSRNPRLRSYDDELLCAAQRLYEWANR